MIQQNGDVLRILNDFRNKMSDLDILISESKIKNIYNLYTKSDLSIDEFRKKIYDRFKKYKENTLCSLNEVENFLGNWKKAWKGIMLFKILK